MLEDFRNKVMGSITSFTARIKGVGNGAVTSVTNAWKALAKLSKRIWYGMTFRSMDPENPYGLGKKLVRLGEALLVVSFLAWNGLYFASAIHIKGFAYDYPNAIVHASKFSPGHETTSPESGTASSKSCGRSQIVDMEIALITFLVDENQWVPSMIQHKLGIFGYPWDNTPFFDRKSMFQKGVMKGVRRTAIELVDTLGRVRGTSSSDPDLEKARSLLQYDMETWWINPFDGGRALVGEPSDDVFRKAIPLLRRYNDRLSKCEALFDARADNLAQLVDRISKDLGSTADQLAKRSRSMQWDPKENKFVKASGNDLSYFDLKADPMFWGSIGEAYAYHGIIQAAREDFIEVVNAQRLQESWDQTESHMAEAILLWPLVVSNGDEDGLIFPAHLASQAQRILRARSNLVEMRGVLSR